MTKPTLSRVFVLRSQIIWSEAPRKTGKGCKGRRGKGYSSGIVIVCLFAIAFFFFHFHFHFLFFFCFLLLLLLQPRRRQGPRQPQRWWRPRHHSAVCGRCDHCEQRQGLDSRVLAKKKKVYIYIKISPIPNSSFDPSFHYRLDSSFDHSSDSN